FLGHQVAPDAAVLGGDFGGNRPVGVDQVAAVQKEIRTALAHCLVDAHAAETRVDAVTLAAGITTPDETDVLRPLRCAAQMPEPGLAQAAIARILETYPVEDRLVSRQPTQVHPGGEIQSLV